MKILITGACGYQGSKIFPILLQKNYKVIAIDTMWFGNRLKRHKNLKILKKNIVDLATSDFKGVNLVLHLASIANDPMGDLKQHLTWEYSCLGTMKLVEFCIANKVKKIIFASSASVYGVKNEKNLLVNLYKKFLEWDILKRPILTRVLEKFFDPIMGKSIVLYFKKK